MPPVRKGFAKPKNAKKTISRLMQYMGSYKYFWILVFICVLLSSGASVLGSYMIKPALNDYIIPLIGKQNPDFSGFLKLLVGVLCLFLVGVLASWINNRLMLHISTNLLFRVRVDLFSKLEKLPIKFYDSHTHGELMSRFTNDTDTMREMMSQTVPQLLSSIITVIAVFSMMIVLSPMLTVVMILTMIFLFQIIKFVGKRSVASFRENQKSVGELNGFIEEMIEGQKVVKVFNHEKKAISEFQQLNEKLRKAGTAAMTYGGVMGPITNNTSHAQYAVVAIIASIFMILGQSHENLLNWFTGALNLGTIAAFLQYTRSFSQPISQISQQANSVLNALAGAERIFAIIDEEPEVDEGLLQDLRISNEQLTSELNEAKNKLLEAEKELEQIKEDYEKATREKKDLLIEKAGLEKKMEIDANNAEILKLEELNNALDEEERRSRAEANKQIDAMWRQAKQEEIEQIRKDKDAEKERASTERALAALENKERREMLARQKEAEKARLAQEKNAQFNTRIKNDTRGAEKAWREGDFSKYNA